MNVFVMAKTGFKPVWTERNTRIAREFEEWRKGKGNDAEAVDHSEFMRRIYEYEP